MADAFMKMPLPGAKAKAPKSKAAPMSSAKEDAAGDVLAAVTANDAKALTAAMTRFYESCADKSEDDEEY